MHERKTEEEIISLQATAIFDAFTKSISSGKCFLIWKEPIPSQVITVLTNKHGLKVLLLKEELEILYKIEMGTDSAFSMLKIK